MLSETTAKDWLKNQITAAIEAGYTTFITGMGMGVDIWAAETVLQLRKDNPSLHLIAVEPCPGFAGKWGRKSLNTTITLQELNAYDRRTIRLPS